MDIKATLTRKIGPLPVWAWGGVVIGGAFVGRKILAKSGGAATASIAGTSNLAETGFGESAVPYDVTGRAPTSMETPATDFADFLPIPEPIFYSDSGGIGFDVPPTPTPVVTPSTGGILTTTKPCTKTHLKPKLGGYPDAPNRECPQGFHLNRVPLTPCFGWCVPN